DNIYSSLQIIDLKNERDCNELCRVGEIRRYYETSIQFEEQLFNRYHKTYDILKEKMERKWQIKGDTRDVILNSILNKWAFWLDEIGLMMKDKTNKIEIIDSLDRFIKQLNDIMNFDDLIQRLVTEPTQLIKLGKCFIKDKKYQRALQVLNRVISDESKFCHTAYYYKAHCIVKGTGLS
ncbi:unnamed protein product, partial [Didymodactylos carnosus]